MGIFEIHVFLDRYFRYLPLLIIGFVTESPAFRLGDKLIDKDEYTGVMNLYGVSKSDAERAFEKFSVVNCMGSIFSYRYL